MSECYSEDSVVNVSWFSGSGKEFVEKSKSATEGTKHKINNTIVWLNGKKAIAELLITMLSPRLVINDTEVEAVSYVRVLYRVQKENDLWKIKGADCIYERDSLQPIVPAANFQLDTNEINKFRKSYCCICYLFSLVGKETNQDLPGDYKPEITAHVHQEATNWVMN